jgi:type II secretory pathway pseudopilin PulG
MNDVAKGDGSVHEMGKLFPAKSLAPSGRTLRAMRRGYSFLEVVVACSILAVVLPLLFNLFPASLRAMKRSGQLQQAVTLAEYRVDEAALLPHPGGATDLNQSVTLDGRQYQVTRTYTAIDIYRTDMTVTVTSPGMVPLVLQTRYTQP